MTRLIVISPRINLLLMLTREKVEATASRIGNTVFQRLIGLDPPKDIFMLDGVIDVPPFTAIGATPGKRDLVVLTPLSDEKTLIHESIHMSTGLGEVATRIMTNIVNLRAMLLPRTREVRYFQCTGCGEDVLLQRLGLRPRDPSHKPQVVHYVLSPTPEERST